MTGCHSSFKIQNHQGIAPDPYYLCLQGNWPWRVAWHTAISNTEWKPHWHKYWWLMNTSHELQKQISLFFHWWFSDVYIKLLSSCASDLLELSSFLYFLWICVLPLLMEVLLKYKTYKATLLVGLFMELQFQSLQVQYSFFHNLSLISIFWSLEQGFTHNIHNFFMNSYLVLEEIWLWMQSNVIVWGGFTGFCIIVFWNDVFEMPSYIPLFFLLYL